LSKNSKKILTFAILLSLGMGVFLPSFVSALPVPDSYEPNDVQGDAASIGEGTYTGLTFDVTDMTDWYVVSVGAEMAISVEIEITYSNEGYYYYLDLEENTNFIWDYDGIRYTTTPSESDDNLGEATIFCKEAADVYINVYTFYSSDATYTMTIDVFDPKGSQKFEYGITTDDTLVYTLSNTVDFEASDNFYTEIEELIRSEVTDEEYYYVVASDFSLQDFTADMEAFISTSVDLQFDITDIYNYDLGGDFSVDLIEGSIRMDVDGNWELPSTWGLTKIEEFKTMIEPYMNSTTYTDDLEPEIDFGISEIETATVADFDDLPLSSHTYFNDVNDFIPFDEFDISNVTGNTMPTYPYNHYIPIGGLMPMGGMMMTSTIFSAFTSASLCYPTTFSFDELYQYGRDIYNYSTILADELGEDVPPFAYTIDQLLEIGGISTFHVDSQSVAIVWASTALNFNTLDALLEYTEGNLESDFADELLYYGIDYENSAASVSFALEYDSDMVLASVASYIDITLAIDGTEQNLPSGVDLDGEIVTISLIQSLVKDGVKAPTIDQINEGDIGEERNLTGGFDFSSIPGYSGLFVGLISIVSTSVLIFRKRR